MPRKAVARETDSSLASPSETEAPRRVRRVAARKRVPEDAIDNSTIDTLAIEKRPVRRKAPARRVSAAAPEAVAGPSFSVSSDVAAPRQSRLRRNRGVSIVVALFLMIGVGISAALGLSDTGEIDVTGRMNEQLQLQANISGEGGEGSSYTVPVQNTQVVDVPNGGLRGRGIGSEPTSPPPAIEAGTTTVATSTSTSTESVEAEANDRPAEEESLAPDNSQTENEITL